jgi:anti-sigma factor (TIGR02949 family)
MTTHDCRDRARVLGSYLDGELEPAKLIEIDEHVVACDTCREEVQLYRAMRGSLRRVVRTAAPAGLRERLGTAMMAERVREDARADASAKEAEVDATGARAPLVSLASWRTMVPLATAAALALVWGAATRGTQGASAEATAGYGADLLAEIVAEHSSPLPLEAKDPDAVRGLERYVGVPVHAASFEGGGINARLVGARVVPLHAQRATMLQYVVSTGTDTRRVSLFVYDAQKIQIGMANLAPREVGTAEVRVGREKGYSVAATQRAGVGYVVAGDLDPDRSAQLAAMVYDER